MRHFHYLVVAICLLSPLASSAQQHVWEVPGHASTIQGAIDIAGDGDLLLIGPGQYQENINYGGKALRVISTDGLSSTEIFGSINVGNTTVEIGGGTGGVATLDGFSIKNDSITHGHIGVKSLGNARISNCNFIGLIGGYGFSEGGAALHLTGSNSVRECQFVDCESRGSGGSIYIYGYDPNQELVFDQCRFENNSSGINGGGIYFDYVKGTVRFIDSQFLFNEALYGTYGGAIYATSDGGEFHFSKSSFSENTADLAGAIYLIDFAKADFEDCHFVNNQSTVSGGGALYIKSSFGLGKPPVAISRSLFIGNIAGAGGSRSGGGVLTRECEIVISESTFSGNQASRGAACSFEWVNGQGQGEGFLNSCIVFGNVNNDVGWYSIANSSNHPVTVDYSCLGDPWTGQGSNNISQDPLFADPGADDFHLQHNATHGAHSPCIDTGDPLLPVVGSTRTDGYPDTGVLDMGYHFGVPYLADLDRDDDGLLDADEIAIHGTDPRQFDSDRDGLGDGLELGVDANSAPPDTDLDIFFPDLDPGSVTNPMTPDSDQGGRLDGVEDGNGNGLADTWETNPANSVDDEFAFDVRFVIPGNRVLFQVEGGTANTLVVPAYSLVGNGPTSTTIGVDLDLSMPISQLTPGFTDLDGNLIWDGPRIPNSAPVGYVIWLQAVEIPFSSNQQPRASNSVVLPIGAN
jgi:predicted outer membrane repeat protein